MKKEQYNDHIWVVVNGESWAIQSIQRKDGWTRLNLWRGYEPDLEYYECTLGPTWDHKQYVRMAKQMLEERSKWNG